MANSLGGSHRHSKRHLYTFVHLSLDGGDHDECNVAPDMPRLFSESEIELLDQLSEERLHFCDAVTTGPVTAGPVI